LPKERPDNFELLAAKRAVDVCTFDQAGTVKSLALYFAVSVDLFDSGVSERFLIEEPRQSVS
jgi:hypothetical protein